MKLMPIDFALLRKSDWKPEPKPPVKRASIEERLYQHRKRRKRIVAKRRKEQFKKAWGL